MLKLIQFIQTILDKIRRDQIGAYAAQSAYFIILSFFPFVMLVMTLLRYLPINSDTLITALIDLVPASSTDVITSILNEILEKSSGTLLSITIITLLWSAGKGLMAVTRGLNSVHEIDETRNYVVLRVISTFYTLLFAIMIIFTLIFLVFGNRLYVWISSYFPPLNHVAAFVISIRTFTSLLLLTFFFMLFYKVLPAKRLNFRHQIPGAIFSSTGWLLCSYAFSIYVDFSKNISYMYGSLAGIILLMLWLYFCMYIMFLGSELNLLIHPDKTDSVILRY